MASLYLRSDGFVEDSDGNFAVVMLILRRRSGDEYLFEFAINHGGPTHAVRWMADEPLQLFPQEISQFLLSRRYARPPGDAEIDAYNGTPAETPQIDPPAPVAPVRVPVPARVKVPAAAPEPAVKMPWEKT